MTTKPLTVSRLKELIAEIFYDKQDVVTKVTNNSAINAVLFGSAKIGQKALVDIANVEVQLFPEFASGNLLDTVAGRSGVPARFSAQGSSTFIRLVGSPATQYVAATNTFSSTSGIIFELSEDITIPDDGYIYANVSSRDVGEKTNVAPHSITKVNPTPTGHSYLVNEFTAIGGSDAESDETFRQRIISYPNILAESTLEKLNQVFISINNNVLRTVYLGLSATGKSRLGVLTQNGSELSVSELDALLVGVQKYVALTDLRQYGNNIYGVQLENIEFYPIDVDFKVDLVLNYDPDELRIELQTKFAKEVDYRFWNNSDIVEWDNLLRIVKANNGVKNVPDKSFYPQSDIVVPENKFPRFRGFIMRDLDGNILVDKQGNLDPVFFTNSITGISQVL